MFNATKKQILELVDSLKPGKLVKIKYMDGDDIALYISKSKDKKTWLRMYYFLARGKITGIKHNMLMFVEEINEV